MGGRPFQGHGIPFIQKKFVGCQLQVRPLRYPYFPLGDRGPNLNGIPLYLEDW